MGAPQTAEGRGGDCLRAERKPPARPAHLPGAWGSVAYRFLCQTSETSFW